VGSRSLVVVSLVALGACNGLADIHEPILVGGAGGHQACSAVADCVVKVPACRAAVACEGGECVFEDAIEGTLVPDQEAGDCLEVVCDGLGGAVIVPVEADVEDDGDPCTEDVCVGVTPVHTPRGHFACYTGPFGTEGVGACEAGVQKCDAQGKPTGGCVAEVVPAEEVCGTPLDEDCDGLVDALDPDCPCGDGFVTAGEECDDGNAVATDGCTTACKFAVCGDGFWHEGGKEECDDGNQDDTDLCLTICKKATCGDGIVQPAAGESCDDKNAVDDDACPDTCQHRVLEVAAGEAHTCARLSGGIVKCWGLNNYGQLGLEDVFPRGHNAAHMGANLPAVNLGQYPDGKDKTALAIAAGVNHTCALLSDGLVKCWGYNNLGQLGSGTLSIGPYGDAPGEMGDILPAVKLGTGDTAQAIAAGYGYTCALLSGGDVKCWGYNFYGQLGQGDNVDRGLKTATMGDSLLPVDLGTGKKAKAITAGYYHACALLNDDSVKCWGYNAYGDLGVGKTSPLGDASGEMGDALPVVDLGTMKTALAVGAGAHHTCALLNDESVKCWGRGEYGALGLGNGSHRGDASNEMGDALPPVDLGSGRTAKAIAVGYYHTCALLDDGTTKCWGANSYGQLGLGDPNNRGAKGGEMGDILPPVDLGAGSTTLGLQGGGRHVCSILQDHRLKCWGRNNYGQIGIGAQGDRGDQPGEMGDNLPFVKVVSNSL
jgi:cysteine-rich repeat protein